VIRNAGAFAGAAVDSPTLVAFMAGLYLATFHITNNLTMLSGTSIVILVLILTVPVTAGVAFMNAFLRMFGKGTLGRALSVFVCAVYMLVVLRGTVFATEAIRHFFEPRDDVGSFLARIFYYAVPAILLTLLFREHLRKLTIVLGAMTIASFAMGLLSATSNLNDGGVGYGSEMAKKLRHVTLSQTPNVYFILADSYSSFSYLNANSIDVSEFRSYLNGADFRLYDEVFSNYHATTSALPAMLNMDHHYYLFNFKSSEVSRSLREIAGGRNNLVHTFRRNGYQIQYIHQWSYLLLHGCSADECFGSDRYGGARIVFNQILPAALRIRIWQETSLKAVKVEVDRLLETDLTPGMSRFQYIHLYKPGHASNLRQGTCDQAKEVAQYSKQIEAVNKYLTIMIDSILSKDPTAVIVLAGDHGPFIENKCQRRFDISTLAEYRDRVGVLMAIRWPSDYEGRYDDRIKTTVNTFRYVLASLADNESELLSTVVSDDVYVMGDNDILKIIENGEVLDTARHYTKVDLRNAYGIR